ncbi:proteoglycan 4-like [Osmerus eperlanus]|uniref:proteoglycan 4-like n=1 Tax=Osmerus eperlanus TaxID=29151 RepID=UPI002E15A401
MAASLMTSGLCLVLLSWSVRCYAGDQGIHWSPLRSLNPAHGAFNGGYGPGPVTNQSVDERFPLSRQLSLRKKPSSSSRNASPVSLFTVLRPTYPAGGAQQKEEKVAAAGLARTAVHASPATGLVAGSSPGHVAPSVRKPAIKGIPINLKKPASSQRSKPASSQRSKPASSQRSKPASSQRSKPASSQRSKPASSQRSKPASSHRSKPASSHRSKLAPLHVSKPAPLHVSKPAPLHVSKPAPLHVSKPAPLHVSKPAPLHVSKPAPLHVSKPAPSHGSRVSPARSKSSDSLHRAAVAYTGLPGNAASVSSGIRGSTISGKGKAERPEFKDASLGVRKPVKGSQSSSAKQEEPMRAPKVRMWSQKPDPMPPTDSSEFVPGELSHLKAEYEHGEEVFETDVSQESPQPQRSEEDSTETTPLKPRWSSHEDQYLPFVRGKLPPGTLTHFSSNYEHGTDHWRDSLYLRMPYPYVPVSSDEWAPQLPMWKGHKVRVQDPPDVSSGAQGKKPKRFHVSRGFHPSKPALSRFQAQGDDQTNLQ